jgi:hypothetical protein
MTTVWIAIMPRSTTVPQRNVLIRGPEVGFSRGAGVRREVWDETGIHVEVDQLTGVYKNTTRGIVALAFPCKPSGGTERTSDESTAVDWLTPEEVAERMSEVYAIRLLDALDSDGPYVRNHDGKRFTVAQ